MDFTWVRVTGDQVVSPNPTKIGSVIITPNADDAKANSSLYDGESENDPPIITIRTGTGITKTINFQPYLQTKRGLYFSRGTNTSAALIQLMWEKE